MQGKALLSSITPRSAMPLATEGTQEPLLHKKGLQPLPKSLANHWQGT